MQPVDTSRDNLTRLLNLGRRKRPRVNRAYSLAVRILQLLLPLVALSIVAVVMAWPRMDETVSPVPREEIIPDTMGRKELIDARYENMNRDGQPYVVTATRAVQEEKNADIILLDSPVADFIDQPGNVLNVRADNGTYNQNAGTLLLRGSVILTKTGGYEFHSEELDVDMKSNRAVTNRDVSAKGPSGTLTATGMTADNVSGTMIFTGPAKMIMTPESKGTKKP